MELKCKEYWIYFFFWLFIEFLICTCYFIYSICFHITCDRFKSDIVCYQINTYLLTHSILHCTGYSLKSW